MSSWPLALLAGIALAAVQYLWRATVRGPAALTGAALRALAVTLLVALVLDAPLGAAPRLAPWAVLDVSGSMTRSDPALLGAARESLATVAAESVLVFGDSVRRAGADTTARDGASVLAPLADRALAAGRPVVIVTDGELDDPAAAAALPPGSRVVVVPRRAAVDLAIASLDAPRAVMGGDSMSVQVTLLTGVRSVPPAPLVALLDGREIGRVSVEALPGSTERRLTLTVAVPAGPPGPAVLTMVAAAPGDAEPRNDTLALAIERSREASAVFVSTAPDYDARHAMGVLRGALAVSTRGYIRVAPALWRVEGTLAPISETQVRTALEEAPLAILHGDTAIFGEPRRRGIGALALIAPPAGDGEWYVSGAPLSPLSASLADLPWDSLAPITVADRPGGSAMPALEARRGRGGVSRPFVFVTESPRRVAVVTASGLWRWQFRGGVGADAYAAVWGAIFDWLAAERTDRRAAIPDAGAFRAGDRIRWRRGSPRDTIVTVTLVRADAPARADSLTLRFTGATTVMSTPPLPAGRYAVSAPGGTSALVVNPSVELLPRAPSVRAGAAGGGSGSAIAGTRRLRDVGAAYIITVLLLCAEWLVRRRAGMR